MTTSTRHTAKKNTRQRPPGRGASARRWLWRALAVVALIALVAVAAGWWWLRGSLPVLEGEQVVEGLANPVTVRRDAAGVAEIEGGDRADIAFALGFLHAQERFFQMDLQRRNAAGELAELFGPAAVDHDTGVRVHRFRARAARNIEQLGGAERVLLERYTGGVNAGLSALRRPPFEYALLGAAPEPWSPEDCLLTTFSMYLELQGAQGRFERGLGLMADTLPEDLFEFFAVQGGEWDAPLAGDTPPPVPVPPTGWSALLPASAEIAYTPVIGDDAVAGSNNWAVSGRLTAHGGALVANDMHLPIRVPNIWYRAAWRHPDTGRPVSGATLPGMPIMVAGSNGRVAWGFTNTQGDWLDVVILEPGPDGGSYRTPEGFEPFAEHRERVMVKGGEPVDVVVRETRWGPVVGKDHRERPLAVRWVAHDVEGASTGGVAMETVDNVTEALALGPSYGIPHQNLVVGDADGAIGWTIAGAVPRRVGMDGVLPRFWGVGGLGWSGYLSGDEHPEVNDPESGRIWTANSRVASGEADRRIGGQGTALGARQRQIRDRLLEQDRFDASDMLAIQLDDRALLLARWQARMLRVLERGPGDDSPDDNSNGRPGGRAWSEARDLVGAWAGRADREDVGYRLVREFRLAAIEKVVAPLVTFLQAQDESFRFWHVSRQIEYPVWALLVERPPQLLNPDFESWNALEQAAVNQVLAPLIDDGELADDTWGEANRLRIRHPLAGAVPPVDWWLSMPAEPMSGDTHMPRVQRPVFGASERFAVSPGREAEAYFHMATGQSAHPLSPFFGAGHEDWVRGRASPWLPGEIRYELRLSPQERR